MGSGKFNVPSHIQVQIPNLSLKFLIAVTAELCKSFGPVICICCCLLTCLPYFGFIYRKKKNTAHLCTSCSKKVECIDDHHFLEWSVDFLIIKLLIVILLLNIWLSCLVSSIYCFHRMV